MNSLTFIGYFKPTGDENLDNLIIDKFFKLGYLVEPDYYFEENFDEDSCHLKIEIDLDPDSDRL